MPLEKFIRNTVTLEEKWAPNLPDDYELQANEEIIEIEKTQSEIAALAQAVLDERNAKEYKIYDLIAEQPDRHDLDKTVAPHSVDYKKGLTTRLNPKFTFNKGQLENVEWYESYDDATKAYDNLILSVDMNYQYNNDLVHKRTTTRTWYKRDGSPSLDTKTTVKYYMAIEPVLVNRKRRQNLLDHMGLTLVGYLYYFAGMIPADGLATVTRLLEKHKTDADDFVRTGITNVITGITTESDAEFSWLDAEISPGVTIRMYMINEMTLH